MVFHAKRLFTGDGRKGKALAALVSAITMSGAFVALGAHPAGATVLGSDVDAAVTAAQASQAFGSDVVFTGTLSSDGTLSAGAATLSVSVTGGAIHTAPGCTIAAGGATASCGASTYPKSFTISVTPSGPGTVKASVTESASDFNVTGDDDECPGSANCSASTSVAQAATSTALTSSPNPTLVNTPVTYTATVSPAPDGGTVAFNDGGGPASSNCGSQALTSGSATCTVTYTSAGSPSVSATYSGDTNYGGSTSNTVTEQIVASDFDLSASSQPTMPNEVSPPGGNFAYTVTVTNDGPVADTASITDAVSGASFGSISSVSQTGTGPCSTSGASASCTATLAPGAGTSVTVTTVTNTTTGSVFNNVTVADSDGSGSLSQETHVLNDPNQSSSLLFASQSLTRNSADQNATFTNAPTVPTLNTTLTDDTVHPSNFYDGLEVTWAAGSTAPSATNPVSVTFVPNNFDPCHGQGLSSGCWQGRLYNQPGPASTITTPTKILLCLGFTGAPNSSGFTGFPTDQNGNVQTACISGISKPNGKTTYQLKFDADNGILGIL